MDEKLIEKEKQLLSDIGGGNVLKILTSEASNGYKKKNLIQHDPKKWMNMHL